MTEPLTRNPYRPVVAIPGVKEPRLLLSFAEAVEVLGEGRGGTLYSLFANGNGVHGVWVVPHPDHRDTL